MARVTDSVPQPELLGQVTVVVGPPKDLDYHFIAGTGEGRGGPKPHSRNARWRQDHATGTGLLALYVGHLQLIRGARGGHGGGGCITGRHHELGHHLAHAGSGGGLRQHQPQELPAHAGESSRTHLAVRDQLHLQVQPGAVSLDVPLAGHHRRPVLPLVRGEAAAGPERRLFEQWPRHVLPRSNGVLELQARGPWVGHSPLHYDHPRARARPGTSPAALPA